MKKAVFVLMALCMIISCFPAAAMANDATLGGTGITVYPIYDTDVVMEEEIIDILVKDGKTYVDCQFFFYNPCEKTTLLVGFPTQQPGGYESQESLNAEISQDYYDEFNIAQLHRFKTFINGKRVPVEVKKGLKPEGNNTEELYFPQWYTWNMTIEKDERLKVVNSYYMENGFGSEDDEWTEYILRSGATWSGTVGKITVRMRFDGYKRESIYFVGMKPTYIDDKGTAIWKAENIEPQEDIEATFNDYPYYDIGDPFEYETPEFASYEKMGRRLMRNFDIKQYNGATWWSHKLIRKFGNKQSDGFYYVVGVSYYKCKRYDKALEMLDKAAQYKNDEYFIASTYCKAHIYRKTNDIINYRECLEKLASYGNNGDEPNDHVYWVQLWAQSRLDDLGEAC